MINDVEDYKEDAEDPKKKLRNPVSNGTLTRKEGLLVSNITLAISLLLYLIISIQINSMSVFIAGLATLIISFLYSWRKVRLKAIPVIDVITHMYMLSGSIFVTSYLTFNPIFNTTAWAGLISVMFVSGYGQLDNEIRDFVVDKKTGIKTIATVIGKKQAIILQMILIGISLLGFIYLGTKIVDVQGFLLKFFTCLIILFTPPLILYLTKRKLNLKVWFHRSLVLSAAATALWILLTTRMLVI
jgi:4-hydroxybenzoate polyprenyltransferase